MAEVGNKSKGKAVERAIDEAKLKGKGKERARDEDKSKGKGKAEEPTVSAEDNIDILSGYYDLMHIHPMEWPSLTVDWLPDRKETPGEDYTQQTIIVGTHTAENEPNYLQLLQVRMPLQDKVIDVGRNYGKDSQGFGYSTDHNVEVKIIKQINHAGEVNRARHMPQNPFLIATKTVSAEVHVFYCNHHPPKPLNGTCNPDLKLMGHNAEGYGLAWNQFKEGHLLSGSDDGRICFWDINATPNNNSLRAMHTFKMHVGVIGDVAWHSKYWPIFGSVGDDRYLHLWDLRAAPTNNPLQSALVHPKEVHALSFHPSNEFIVATGSADGIVKLFDLRKLPSELYNLEGERDEVFQVEWHPKNENIIAASCLGWAVNIWDMSRIGRAGRGGGDENDDRVVPAELIFTHNEHSGGVWDLSWNPCEDWLVASVADDNTFQIWQVAEDVYMDMDDTTRLVDKLSL